MAPETQIWERVEEALYQLYDVEEIECIELMGDVANKEKIEKIRTI